MKFYVTTPSQRLILLTVLYTFNLHLNKYILSVLGFTYPTVFQGWQTLVAVVLMRMLMFQQVTPLCWNTLCAYSPLFLCFVIAIVTGSKALSSLPIPVIVASSNAVPATVQLASAVHLGVKSYKTLIASCFCLLSVVGVFLVDPILSEKGKSSLWLLTHLLFLGAQSATNLRGTSQVLSSFEKLFYCNLFSVVVLAPSSLYLEEAFEALHFQERKQLSFLIGCVISGVIGTFVSVLLTRSPTESIHVDGISRAIACFLSPYILPCQLNFPTWGFIASSMITVCLLHDGTTTFTEKLEGTKPKQLEAV